MTVSWRPVMLAKDLLRGDTTLHLQDGNGVKLGDVLVPAGEYERILVVQVTTPTSFQVVRGQHRSDVLLPGHALHYYEPLPR